MRRSHSHTRYGGGRRCELLLKSCPRRRLREGCQLLVNVRSVRTRVTRDAFTTHLAHYKLLYIAPPGLQTSAKLLFYYFLCDFSLLWTLLNIIRLFRVTISFRFSTMKVSSEWRGQLVAGAVESCCRSRLSSARLSRGCQCLQPRTWPRRTPARRNAAKNFLRKHCRCLSEVARGTASTATMTLTCSAWLSVDYMYVKTRSAVFLLFFFRWRRRCSPLD